MLIIILLLIFTTTFIQGSDTTDKSDLCGPLAWQVYRDSKCFQLLEIKNTELLTYAEASDLCKAAHPDSTLPTISSAEEQGHILSLTKSQSIWLGARLNTSVIKWEDDSTSDFNNWSDFIRVPPQGQFCIMMGDSAHAHGEGKWIFETCIKKNLVAVLCQKPQFWTPRMIQKYFEKRLGIDESRFKKNEDLMTSLRNDLQRYQEELQNLKAEKEAAVTEAPSVLIPMGFIYIQYRNQSAPKTLWPSYNWADISREFAGEFFRVVGGASGSYGFTQEGNSPRITQVDYADVQPPNTITIPIGGTSEYIRTGPYSGNSDTVGIAFTTSGGEVRPYNSAVKIWKRIQ